VVSLGVGALVANDPAGMTALTLAGAVYLTYLGVHTLRSRAAVPADEAPATATSRGRYVTRGMGVSALNPKGMLLFIAILPQFASRHAGWPLPAQLAGLGVVYVAIAIAFYLALGFLARSILGSRPAVSSLTTTIAGVAMVVAGVGLVAERLFGQ
jgi:threonine/homoserine/homoserine lactone efflux protein